MQRWQGECIDRLLATGLVEIALIIEDHRDNYPPASLWQKLKRVGASRALFAIYDRVLLRPVSRRAVDMTAKLAGVPVLACIVDRKGWSQYFQPDDVASVRSHGLDLILRLGFNIIRGDILQSAKHGVWSFHHGDEMKYRGGPPCFWEIHDGDPETGAILQRLTDQLDAGVVLRKGIFRTKRHSYARNIDQAYFESARWPALVCRDIARGCAQYVDGAPSSTRAPVRRSPSNGQLIRALGRMAAGAARQLLFRTVIMQRWNVAILRMPIERLLEAAPDDIRRSALPALPLRTKRSFNADCFGLPAEQGHAILFEELDYGSGGQGRIACALVDGDGNELRRTYPTGGPATGHSSYPFVFRQGSDIYMIPETRAQKRISLFRAESFPDRWTWVADLMIGQPFVDATLVQHDGRFWLFYTVSDEEHDADLHLNIAYSDRLDGPFTAHPANPVKVSARSSRPAGTPFVNRRGQLVRPAQNFCRTYGGSIVFNRLLTLTPDRFAEEEVAELRPFDTVYRNGIHTVAALDDAHCVVDMKRHVLVWPWEGRS